MGVKYWGPGGGSGGGATGAAYAIPSAGTYILVAPGAVATQYAENTAVLVMAGATGAIGQTGHQMDGTALPPVPQFAGASVPLTRWTSDYGQTWHLCGVPPAGSIGDWTLAAILALDANLYEGCIARVSGAVFDVAGTGADAATTLMISRGGRFRYLNGFQVHRLLPAQGATRQGAEAVDQLVRFAAGLPQTGDHVEVTMACEKSGLTDIATHTWRMGSAGTTADARIVGVSSGAPAGAGIASPNAASRSLGEHPQVWRFDSATSIRKLGSFNDPAPFNGVANANLAPVAQTIPSVLTADSYLSFLWATNGSTDTIRTTGYKAAHVMAP